MIQHNLKIVFNRDILGFQVPIGRIITETDYVSDTYGINEAEGSSEVQEEVQRNVHMHNTSSGTEYFSVGSSTETLDNHLDTIYVSFKEIPKQSVLEEMIRNAKYALSRLGLENHYITNVEFSTKFMDLDSI